MIEITYITTLVFILPLSILIHLVFSFGKRKHYPSGPFGLPIFGHLPFIGHSPPETFLQWSQKYGNVFSIRMGSWKTVVVNGYEAIKEAASKADDAFSGRPEFVTQKMLENVHGEVSLGFGPFDDIYLHHRKLVANSLRYFTNKKSEYTENLIIDEAEKLVVNVLNKSGQPVDIRSHIQYATGSVIYQILYGKGGDLKEQLDKMVRSLDELIKFTGNGNPFDVMPWLQYIMPWKISSFRKSIEDALLIRRRRVSDHVKSVSSDYIRDLTDLLLTMDMQEKKVGNNGLTRSRLIGSTADLEGAGFDTSNKSLQWAILYMAEYPEVQQRVQKEIDDVIGSGQRVELKDKPRLTYTEATILEIMRMTSIAPFALPKIAIKDTLLQGYNIDKGTVVFFNIHSISYDTNFWGDPQIFRPERLIDDNNKLIKEKCNHIVPFGLGRRRCVGEFLAKMEQFLFFANILRRCKLFKAPGVQYDLEPELGLVYSPKPFKVVIEERQ